jgi:putative phosphoesterase
MKIGILSDIHDNVKNLELALEVFEKEDVRQLLCCGDFISGIPMRKLGSFEGHVDCVFGNNDGDKVLLHNVIQDNQLDITIHGDYAAFEVDGIRVVMTHYPFYGKAMAKSGDYDLVACGHTHVANLWEFDGCLLVNPGPVLGFLHSPSVAIFDTEKKKIEFIELKQN